MCVCVYAYTRIYAAAAAAGNPNSACRLVAPCLLPIIFEKRNYLGILASIEVPFQATWLICLCPPPLHMGPLQ